MGTNQGSAAKSVAVVAVLVVALLAMGAAPATKAVGAMPVAAKQPVRMAEAMTFQLTDSEVIDKGQTTVTKEGTLTMNYKVHAHAFGKEGAPFPVGRFTLTLTAFSPAKDMPGQPKGKWYVRGTWQLDAADAEKVNRPRHNPGVLRGYVNAVLTSSPVEDGIKPSTLVEMSMNPAAGSRGKGGWVFSGSDMFAGTITLQREALIPVAPSGRTQP